MNWIDAVLIVILVIFVAFGFWKGFIFSILSLFSFFINFSISILLTRPLTNLFNSWFGLEGALTNSFSTKISSMGEGFSTNLVGMTNSEISEHVSTTLESSNFPLKNMFERMLNINADKIADKTSLTLNDILSKSLGSFFSLIISFVVVFILIYLILFLISRISKKAKEVDSIRIIDRLLGVFFGLIKGALCIVTIFAVLSFFKEDGVLEPLFDYISQSELSSWIYNNINLLVDKYITLENITTAIKDTQVI